MSSPTPPLQPTRQQLDELEALMQRMLALPVNQLDGGPDDELALPTLAPIDMPPVWETEPVVLSTETTRQNRDSAAAVKNGAAPQAVVSSAAEEERPRLAETEENVDPVAANLTIVRRPAPTERPWSLPAGARRVPLVLRPLVLVNRAFDRTVGLLGAPGRWLRGPRGRAAIGWTGVALLATAFTWAFLEWMGWTW